MKHILLILFASLSIAGYSQPLNITTSLAGNYGELRTGRYHAGVDFRVGGVVGEKIYSVADGYIYRLTVSPSGYGNAVYIKHKDGVFSIYGHLLNFAPQLQERVKQEQYEKKSFAVSVFLDPQDFPVSKGDFIGKVGNTGSSVAPHLHFELRNSENTSPLNSISRGYVSVEDNIPPVFRELRFYSYLKESGVVTSELLAKYHSDAKDILYLPERSFIAIDAFDRQDGTTGKLGIADYSVYLDNDKIFSFQIGEYEFTDAKYFNSLIHYPAWIDTHRNFIKSYVEPGNMISHKLFYADSGLIVLEDYDLHILRVELTDEFGNMSRRRFRIQRGDPELSAPESFSKSIFMPWFTPNIYMTDGMSFTLAPGSLYNSINFVADSVGKGEYAPIWSVHTSDVALASRGRLGIDADVPEQLRDKAVIVKVSDSGNYYSCGGTWKDNTLFANISSFGNYTVSVDTTAPIIKPRFSKLAYISSVGQFSFTIKDELSGIASYSVEIDGEWVLAQFDAKYSKLWVELSGHLAKERRLRDVVVKVVDNRSNINEYKFELLW